MTHEKRLPQLRQSFFISAWKFYDLTFMRLFMFSSPGEETVNIVWIPVLNGGMTGIHGDI